MAEAARRSSESPRRPVEGAPAARRLGRALELVERTCPCCGGEAFAPFATGVDYEHGTCSNVFTFVRCRSCGTVFLNPRPRVEDLPVIYPKACSSAAEAAGRGAGPLVRAARDAVERGRVRQLLEAIGARPARVLEVGCGDGRLLRALRRDGPPGLVLEGVELGLGPEVVARLAEQDIAVHQGVYEDLAFDEEGFDLVVAEQVVEHTFEPGRLLDKMRRELRGGAYAVLDMPSLESLDHRLFRRGTWGGYHFPRHLTLFTPETFGRLARDRGFELLSARPLASPTFWIASLHNAAAAAGLPGWLTSRLTGRSLPLLAAATALEVPALMGLRPSSSLRVVLRKPRARAPVGSVRRAGRRAR